MRAYLLALLVTMSMPSWAQSWRGFVAVEPRYFVEEALLPDQHDAYASIVAQPEGHAAWDGGRQSITVAPFYRWDQHDGQRSHADLRELFWLYVGDRFEVRVGVHTVFWGVTESQHLVDVINQTDLVEDPDGEDKLGQPMASATLYSSYGTWQLFVLPVFRERTFPGPEGRLRTQPRVDTDEALYEHARGDRHVDLAARWSQTAGAWDIGVSHFYGTNRDPQLLLAVTERGEPVLRPFYEIVHQTGLDLQATYGSWLLKLEAIRRAIEAQTYEAATFGFEYTRFGVFGTNVDLGWVAEYLYDSRGDAASSPLEDDVMLGVRVTANDVSSTQLLLAVISDRDSNSRLFSLEAQRRLTDHVRVDVEGRAFASDAPADPLYGLRRDDYLQVRIGYYF